MRLIVGITMLLVGVGTLSCRIESPSRAELKSAVVGQWVRTVNGWERNDNWQVAPAEPPSLHPLVVAAGQGLISVLGLVAFRREN